MTQVPALLDSDPVDPVAGHEMSEEDYMKAYRQADALYAKVLQA